MIPAVPDTITIEGAVLYRDIPINDAMVRTYGRLIVNRGALFFLHGWEETRESTQGGGGAMLTIIDAISRRFGLQGSIANVGQELLNEVAHLPPNEQFQRIPGSLMVDVQDLDQPRVRARLLEVRTKKHGEKFSILLPKAATKRIETWIKLHLG